jgi:hypothetical protein
MTARSAAASLAWGGEAGMSGAKGRSRSPQAAANSKEVAIRMGEARIGCSGLGWKVGYRSQASMREVKARSRPPGLGR